MTEIGMALSGGYKVEEKIEVGLREKIHAEKNEGERRRKEWDSELEKNEIFCR